MTPDRNAVVIRRITDADRGPVVRATRRVFRETNAQKKDVFDEDFWTWQYASGVADNMNIVAVDKSTGDIVGSYPNLLLPLHCFGQPGRATICQDLLIDPSYRLHGLFSRMGSFSEDLMHQAGVELSYAFPNGRSLGGFLKKHHYELLAEVPLYVKPLSFRTLMSTKWGSTLGAFGALPDLALPLLRLPAPGNPYRLVPMPDPEVAAPIWAGFQDEHGVLLRRDPDFLRWRFYDRPNHPYQGLLLKRGGEAVAYAIVRKGTLFGTDVGLLMDFASAPGGDDHLPALLGHVERWAAGEGLGMLVFILLAKRALRSRITRLRYVQVPSRLNPRKFNLTVRTNIEGLPLAKAYDPDNWFVTLADWDVL